jgi:glutamine amidotransferase
MNLAIIKYNAGNIQSVLNALERLGYGATVTDDAAQIKAADKVIFPGVGEASSAMNSLKQNGLDDVIRELRQPVFGICVGMQLLCARSEENDTPCLGIVPLPVKKFSAGVVKPSLKVPQMGWNTVEDLQTPLFAGVPEKSYIYNVHSYYAEDSEYTIARCHYGTPYAAAIRKDNFYGVQFHTEKSAGVGDRILQNFIQLI